MRSLILCVILSGCTSTDSEKSHSCEVVCEVCQGLVVTCKVYLDKTLVEVTGN
jgi:hypothetical protein